MLHLAAARHRREATSNESGKTCTPQNDGTGAGSDQVEGRASTVEWIGSVLATFLVSIAFHEAVALVVYRGTCIPFNTFLLSVAAMLVISWDVIFPVRGKSHGHGSFSAAQVAVKTAVVTPDDYSCDAGSNTAIALNANSDVDYKTTVTPVFAEKTHIGGDIAKIFVFNLLVQMSVLISECAGWLLWRDVLMK